MTRRGTRRGRERRHHGAGVDWAAAGGASSPSPPLAAGRQRFPTAVDLVSDQFAVCLHDPARPPVTLRVMTAELVDDGVGVEADRARVVADECPREYA